MPARGNHGCDSGCGDPGPAKRDAGCALGRAVAVQGRARRRGFDWDEAAEALEKVREETEEVAAALAGGGGEGRRAAGATVEAAVAQSLAAGGREERANSPLADELGDLLFAVANVARMTGIDPAAALAGATARFEARFAEVERIARKRRLPMPGTPLGELDRIWEEVKAGIG